MPRDGHGLLITLFQVIAVCLQFMIPKQLLNSYLLLPCSSNWEALEEVKNVDMQFKYSDHQPVFWVVKINKMSINYIIFAIPFFLLLIGIEVLVQKRKRFSLKRFDCQP